MTGTILDLADSHVSVLATLLTDEERPTEHALIVGATRRSALAALAIVEDELGEAVTVTRRAVGREQLTLSDGSTVRITSARSIYTTRGNDYDWVAVEPSVWRPELAEEIEPSLVIRQGLAFAARFDEEHADGATA